jgi:hypothetical protein
MLFTAKLRQRWFCFVLLLILGSAGGSRLAAQTQPAGAAFKIKIEAIDADRQLLLDRLNVDGAADHVTFALAERGFDYRMVFSITHAPLSDTQRQINSSGATAKVFDASGTELFHLDRQARFTNTGAANAIAKDIISRLTKLKSPPPAS